MKEEKPALTDWKSLYNAASEFKKIKCWEWMLDSDIFGVKDPYHERIGYCCIMGYLGEHFALAVYMGSEGLNIYLKIQNRELPDNDIESLMAQNCLMASFEDWEFLDEEDINVLNKIKLRYKGFRPWPLFRSYRPGYHPWYLTKDEAKFLTQALKQSKEVALRFKENPEMLKPPKKGQYLVRIPKKWGRGWQWHDEWLKPEPLEEEKLVIPPINEIKLQKLKNKVKRRTGSWEADIFYAPTPIKEGDERPYYPYAAIFVDGVSGMVLHADVIKHEDYTTRFPNALMELIENTGVKPLEILVRRDEAYEMLELIASRLNINIKKKKKLKTLEMVQASMMQFFTR
ncbi:hypothetical protein GF312_10335 [Candidatus Poribacteria bacterium]|nr:hypothetical protein [Candidatus Poribacteria bacterium]